MANGLNMIIKEIWFHKYFTKNNQRHGSAKGWYNNGKIKYERNYINGIKEGKITKYYKNGSIQYEGNYQNGIKNGTWKKYGK